MSAAAANGAAPAAAPQFGIGDALTQGGVIAWLTLGVLVIMSAGSWYIFFVKLIDQNRIIREGRRARTTFWQSPTLRDAANKLDKNGAYRQIVEDGLLAEEQHNKLTDPTDQHEWMMSSLTRSQGAITSKLSGGLAFLATVGSTAPFVGLFGTVVGILNAFQAIATQKTSGIGAVAGGISEALVTTAFGLLVAIPAVMTFNYFTNKVEAFDVEMDNSSSELFDYLIKQGHR
jgi:biopolymer transport protein ExbB